MVDVTFKVGGLGPFEGKLITEGKHIGLDRHLSFHAPDGLTPVSIGDDNRLEIHLPNGEVLSGKYIRANFQGEKSYMVVTLDAKT